MAVLAPLLAFLAYGGWALWLNVHAENPQAWHPAVVHGTYAALLTLGLHFSVTWTRQRLHGTVRHPRFATWAVATLLSFFVPLAIQALVGNYRSLATIAPGFIIGQLYIWGLLGYRDSAAAPGRTSPGNG